MREQLLSTSSTTNEYEQYELHNLDLFTSTTGKYASQIDSLRRENESAVQALKSAQTLAQQRVLERDSYFLTVDELEMNFTKLQQKYADMEKELTVATGTKKTMEARLQEAQLELDVMSHSVKIARKEAESKVAQVHKIEKAAKVQTLFLNYVYNRC